MLRGSEAAKVSLLATMALFFCVTSCTRKQPVEQSEPPASILSHQGTAAGIAPLDKTRSASAQTILNSDPELAPLHLQVSVFNDTATVTGSVRNEEQKQKVETLVLRVSGVNKVVNQIQIIH